MRFIHMADVHFDSPFTVITDKRDFWTKRRLEQRDAFWNAIKYIYDQKIPYLFIAGDLYDQNYIKMSTIEFINGQFKTIPDTKIFITPGNHDPFLKNSFYNTFNWSDNVKIFNDKVERIEFEDVDIYGWGFSDFYCSNSGVENIQIKNKEKINILIVHGALDSSKRIDDNYNPISTSKLKEIGFDYIALGHVHKRIDDNKYNFIYPGSMISFGFDELGEHGMLDIILEKNNEKINNNILNNELNNIENKLNKNNYLNNLEENNLINKNKINNLKNNNINLNNIEKNKKINEDKIKINFIKLDNRNFEEKNFDISEINSEEELIERINLIKINENNFYKIILTGTKNIEINTNEICKLIKNKNILKIKDKTEIKYNLNELRTQKNLKGIFVKKMIEKAKDSNLNEEEVKRAIEIGLKLFE